MEENFVSDGMLDMYLYENFQLLEQLDAIVLSEKNEEFFDEESINEIFRIMHTIKGSSAIMMYDNISLAAHKLEDIFYYLRETYTEEVSRTKLSEYIFKVSDFITCELSKIKDGRCSEGNPDKIVEEIDAFVQEWKCRQQAKGGTLPPENLYVKPNQYYIAPIADSGEIEPIKIDLGTEPEPIPGDYIINNGNIKGGNIIGISEGKLDKLSGEIRTLSKISKSVRPDMNCQEVKRKLEKITIELQNTVSDMRKTTLTSTFRRMNRIVFDASRKLNKDIKFNISGEGLEVDRGIVEHIADTLIHLVRNAADHGIEEREIRRAAGKKEQGVISIDADIKNEILYICVKDDGKGINKEEVFFNANQKGITNKGNDIRQYSDQDIYRFITYPGFTTKNNITEYSGRGVGMDAVMQTLAQIHGKLEIDSRLGDGTLIIMEIPLCQSEQNI